ncbi:PQQ-binding-like beta-propeller repeat protein [Saliphagus sp. GCM10025317]
METPLSRRSYVALAGATGLSAFGGCAETNARPESGRDAGSDGEGEVEDGNSETNSNALDDAASTFADGWSTFRGDAARTGVRPGEAGPGDSVSVSWELTTAALVADLEGIDAPSETSAPRSIATSSPILTVEHVVWTVAYDFDPETGDREGTIRLLAATRGGGEIAWSQEAGKEDEVSYFRHAPAIDGSALYVPFSSEGDIGIAVFDPMTGEQWDRFEFGLSPTAGHPLVVDGTIYVRDGGDRRGKLRAFDAETGRSLWSVECAHPDAARPGLTATEGTIQYFSRANPDECEYVARARSDGAERWRAPIDLPASRVLRPGSPTVLSSPTVVGGSAYASGTLDAMLQRDTAPLVSFDPETGEERWQYEPSGLESDDDPTVGPNTPQKVIDQLPPFAAIYGYPVIVDGLAVVTGYGDPADGSNENGSETGSYVFAVDTDDGSLAWTLAIDAPSFSPVAAGNVVYVSTDEGVVAVSTSGERLDSASIGLPVVGQSPAIGGGTLFVPTIEGLVALE